MINKTKLLNEILENSPELKDKKSELKDLIDILLKNNPNIKPDAKFKKDLKEKIDTVINMEDKAVRKLSLFTAIIQALSLAFVIGGVYYSFNQFDFINKDDELKINPPKKIILEESINDDYVEDIVIEDTQIIDLLGEPKNAGVNNSRMMGESMMIKTTMDIKNDIEEDGNNFEQKSSFEEYCEENLGDILNIEGINICIVEGKQCIEEDYNEGICNFVEIK